MSLAIHPLPILNVSDHVTRARLIEQDVVIGALLGSQVNRQSVVANSFELQVNEAIISEDFFANRKDQFKQVFPSLEIIGWYSTKADLKLHEQVSRLVENPIFVLFEPVANELPLVAYESTLEGGISKIEYVIETGEAERIAVDGASKGMEEDQVGHLTTQRNAITMLVDRVQVLRDYVQRVQEGTASADHAVLRQISALTAQLPLVDVNGFARELQSEYSDVQLAVYLGSTLKQLDALVELADKEKSPMDGAGKASGGRRR